MTQNRRFRIPFVLIIAIIATSSLRAQVVPSAFKNAFSLNAGVMASAFKPDYGPNKLGGLGAWADLNLFHGLGIEGEGRWLRIHEYQNVSQDNYLIGPRYRFHHIWLATPYVKVLAGAASMNFQNNIATGRFTDIAYGGGVDVRLTRRINIRAVDFEFQQWPKFLNSSLYPAGISAGVSYRIF